MRRGLTGENCWGQPAGLGEKTIHSLSTQETRRVALCVAGLLNPHWTGMPERATGRGTRARHAALRILQRFGYLQLDTVSVAGARSHGLVLLSRLPGIHSDLGEELLQPGQGIFEYWGHEASWLPLDLYPAFEFRRQRFRRSAWCKEILQSNRAVARDLRAKIAEEGPIRSLDLEGKSAGGGWWNHKPAKRVAIALWSAGELAIRERRGFQRTFDLVERVIPEEFRATPLSLADSLRPLLLRALDGHGWAQTGTLAGTWRLLNLRPQIQRALNELQEAGSIEPCVHIDENGKRTAGWIRPEHLELAGRLGRVRPDPESARLLSPFDPILWDRNRVVRLFGFEQVLEIFKPEPQRVYGYFCLPVLAGEQLVARVDLRADRKAGVLQVIASHLEPGKRVGPRRAVDCRTALRTAVERHARSLDLVVSWK